jgi:hypothetical protein
MRGTEGGDILEKERNNENSKERRKNETVESKYFLMKYVV